MRALNGSLLALASLAALALPQTAAAQDAGLVIDRYTCRDLLRESGIDRDVAVAFMHGYLLGKAGVTTFARESARAHAAEFIERCLDEPKQSAIEAMAKVAAGSGNGRANPARP